MEFKARAAAATHPKARQLFELMENKKTNLSVSADVTKADALIQLIHAVGPEICMLKTHIDVLEDFTSDLIHEITTLSKQYDFLIFEDRKFADIGNTVQLQFQKGIYRIAEWADLINAHVIPGPSIIEGLKAGRVKSDTGLLLLAQMSSHQNLCTRDYTQATVKMARTHPDFVMGFIAQERLCDEPGMIHFTPGVQLKEGQDALGQRYHTPESVMIESQSDVIIVGRGIYASADPKAAAREYRERAWQAYRRREHLA